VIGIIAVSLLVMGLLLLTEMHHQDIASFAKATVFLVVAGAIRAFHVLNRSTGTLREVRSVPFLLLHSPFLLFLLLLPHSSFGCDQRDEHATEQEKDREISTAKAVTGFRHCLLQELPKG
jgi:Ca2+/Na+ antiporter